ncbi:MAG: TaqI-like C-terminal specificity domain-containing protein, partial [Kiritimatiellales bacterium]
MTENEQLLQNLIENCSEETAKAFFRRKNVHFKAQNEALENADPERFSNIWKIGRLDFEADTVVFAFAEVKADLSERTCRKAQFEAARKILRAENADAGLFLFKGANGAFRLSLVYKAYQGTKAELSPYRRFTYFVQPDSTGNTTFKRQIDRCAFDSLEAIKQAFSIEAVSKEFYRELSNWYFWALKHIHFPKQNNLSDAERNPVCTIRLITRLMFVWFMKQMNLIPGEFFDREKLDGMLKSLNPDESTYYKAVLQNLFFATLNTEMDNPKVPRRFRTSRDKGLDGSYGIHSVYRYRDLLRDPDATLERFKTVPFLNGGLFECLDNTEVRPIVRIDGFSDRDDNELRVPNFLFFGEEHAEDLSDAYGDKKRKNERVSGLLDILSRYNFTVIENTPHESEVALDPELLGMVFENLLAAYNPETGATARKQTGSFYTPREIVSYMVDESLIQHLKTALGISEPRIDANERELEPSKQSAIINHQSEMEAKLRDLLSYDTEGNPFNESETGALIAAVDACKIIDPACGSGAFPMGVLHKLVLILSKLDPGNEQWLRTQCDKLDDVTMRDELERNFRENAEDYGRKLCLIENCIYGVDIQPIACQISKLRFFISLLCDQIVNPDRPNLGIRPLPNLETKFVAANTLIGIDMPADWTNDATISRLEGELKTIRHRHFSARTSETKRKYRDLDQTKRKELKEHLVAIATRPDETKITRFQQQIEKLRTDREKFSGEKWVEEKRAAQQDFLTEHQPEQQALFRVDLNARKREEIDRKIRELERAITAERAKAENTGFEAEAQKLADWNPYDQNASAPFFDPEWMFAVTDGFDVVIGNPPYVLMQAKNRDESMIKYFRQQYKVASYKLDLYHLFIEKGVTLLKRAGTISLITPSNFVSNNFAFSLRKFLLTETNLRELLFFDEGVFDASVHNVVFIAQKMDSKNVYTRFCKAEVSDSGLSIESKSKVKQAELVDDMCLLVLHTGNAADSIIRKMNQAGETFGSVASINFGMQLRDRKEFPQDVVESPLSKSSLTKFHRECYAGKDIHRFHVTFTNRYCYFNREVKRGGCWDENIHNAKNKILVRQIGDYPEGGIDVNGYAVLNAAFIILPKTKALDSKFLLGVLNSSAIRFYWLNKFRDDRKTFPKIKGEYLKLLPVPSATPAQQKKIEGLVERILALKKKDPVADISALEGSIGQLVYKLYDLTDEEIRIIDPEYQPGVVAPSAEQIDEGKWVVSMLAYLYASKEDLVAIAEMTMAQILIADDDLRKR